MSHRTDTLSARIGQAGGTRSKSLPQLEAKRLLLHRLAPEWTWYRIRSIGGVRGKILYDVVVVSMDDVGRELKKIEGAECRILIDDGQRRAEMRFKNGFIHYYGVRAPFWGGKYVVPLVNIDVSAWRGSGLTIFGDVR